jgi:hypothetical protein
VQNDIGRKSKLHVLRQRRSKEALGGGGGAGCHAVLGQDGRRSAQRWVLDSCRRFTQDRMLAAAKTPGGLERPSFVTIMKILNLDTTFTILYSVLSTNKIGFLCLPTNRSGLPVLERLGRQPIGAGRNFRQKNRWVEGGGGYARPSLPISISIKY